MKNTLTSFPNIKCGNQLKATMTDKKLQRLYEQYLEFTDHMCSEHGPLEVAAIMMAQSLTIYKSALSEEEYNLMVDNISNSRNKVKAFTKPILQ
jgi:hypothetical protein